MSTSVYDLLVILGPTASGKTTLAAHWAARNGGEILSADSRQVYRGMTIGTGKDLSDYEIPGFGRVPCHLTDIADAGYHYNVFEYQRDFLRAFEEVRSRGKVPVLCGGSGMYIEAVLSGYRLIQVSPDLALRERMASMTDEALTGLLCSLKPLHNHSDTENRKRLMRAVEIALYQRDHPSEDADDPRLQPLIIGMLPDRETRRARITARLRQRLGEGLIEEVQELLRGGLTASDLEYYGLEYKFVTRYLTGELSRAEMETQLNTAIHQFAKRQMTWFRKMERDGFCIHWLDGDWALSEMLLAIDALYYR